MASLPAAGAGLKAVWHDVPLSWGAAPSAMMMPAPNIVKKNPSTAVRKPEPTAISLSYKQRFLTRGELLSRAIGGKAPHAEYHLPGSGVHRPSEWDIETYNHEVLLQSFANEAAGVGRPRTPRGKVTGEVVRASKRAFTVNDSMKDGEGEARFKLDKNRSMYVQLTGVMSPITETNCATKVRIPSLESTILMADQQCNASSLPSKTFSYSSSVTRATNPNYSGTQNNSATLFQKRTLNPIRLSNDQRHSFAESFNKSLNNGSITRSISTAPVLLAPVAGYQGHIPQHLTKSLRYDTTRRSFGGSINDFGDGNVLHRSFG